MYNVTFSYGKDIQIPKSVITNKTDKILQVYYSIGTSQYISYSSLGLSIGDSLYIKKPLTSANIYISTISYIAPAVLTIATNPGRYPLGICERMGFIEPFVKKDKTLVSYPLYNYCGTYVVTFGNHYTTYPEDEPYDSSASTVSTNSVLAICFKKGDFVEEVRLTATRGKEMEAIQKINTLFRQESDINFDYFLSSSRNPIKSVDTIVSNNTSGAY